LIKLTKRTLNDVFTGPDGQTFAIGRIGGALTLVSGLVLPFWAVAKGQAINFAELGVYWGGVGAAATALIKLTNSTEPPPAA
jgi:hypothetical protein